MKFIIKLDLSRDERVEDGLVISVPRANCIWRHTEPVHYSASVSIDDERWLTSSINHDVISRFFANSVNG